MDVKSESLEDGGMFGELLSVSAHKKDQNF
jgi:hypothetical protein